MKKRHVKRLIFTKTLEEHRTVTSKVLRILADNGLSLKPEKCEWEKMKVAYLGMIVSEEGSGEGGSGENVARTKGFFL